MSAQDLDTAPGTILEAERPLDLSLPGLALLGGSLLTACGGGGADGAPAPAPIPVPAPTPVVLPPTATQAARFLIQSSMGATREEITSVQSLGYAAWLEAQFALPPTQARWDWLKAAGFGELTNKNGENGADACCWKKMLSSPDTLRQRVTLALSEIVVTSISGLVGSGWKSFSAAAHMDTLEAHAFGNYRTLLQEVSLSAPMGEYLTYRNNIKYNPKTGALPDENYAREIMQLFTIGLVQLNLDGTPKLAGGQPQETYGLEDIAGLARVFTGWNYDMTGLTADTPDFKRRSMSQVAGRHETGAKTFLGSTIAENTDAMSSMTRALDILYAHPNVAPFISRQLIQRLVCSNPSPAYVARVATVFNNDGTGVKGDMKVVLRAILLDTEARGATGMAEPGFGKLREPILRMAAWARAFKADSPSGAWAVGNTSDPSTRLGQSPMRSGSVFNFFRPGYVPPNSAMAGTGMVAPEFQIANESTVVGYINFMQNVVSRGVGDVKADYSSWLALANTPQELLNDINLLLAAGQLSSATLSVIKTALDSMPASTDAQRLNRIYAAVVLTLAAPEFIVQK